MPIAQNIVAFNAGELSPLLDARTDIEKYASGCRELQNFITTPYGPNMRRPGTEYGGEVKDSTKRTRLLPFAFSEAVRYQIELGEGYMRFWDASVFSPVVYGEQDGWSTGQAYDVGALVTQAGLQYRCLVAHTSGVFATDLAAGKWVQVTIQEVFTSYLASELADVQFVEINDIAIFTHPAHPPFYLQRGIFRGLVLFSGNDMAYDWPPLLEENSAVIPSGVPTNAIRPSETTGNITLTQATGKLGDIFSPAQAGAYFQISHPNTTASIPLVLTANGTSSQIRIMGAWSLFTYGTWTGTLTIERSYDNGSIWFPIRSYAAAGDRNIAPSGNESRDCLLRMKYVGSGSSGANVVLETDSSIYNGLVKVTAYLTPDMLSATVIRPLYSTDATTIWAEGAWSDYRGYPRAVAVHEDRVLFGGTAYRPQSIWGTQLDDFQNFRLGSIASDGLYFTIASTRTSIIQWMASKDGFLHVGREGSEGRVNSSEAGSSISPSDIQWTPTTSYGSKHLPAVILNDALLFVQGQGRKVRSLAQVQNTAAFSGQDVTILSEHITKGEIVEFAAQNLPDATLWCVRGDGALLGMSYDSLSSVVAWHRHLTEGSFESVSVIPGEYGDEVWFIVNRTVNGSTKRFVERFRPGWREVWEDEDKGDWWYLDCAKQIVNSPAAVTVYGLNHLEGKCVRVLSDGADAGTYTVTGGAITLSVAGSVNTVGLPYVSIMRPMKLEAQMRNGTAQGRKSKIDRVVVRLLKSLGGRYSTDGLNYSDIPFRTAQDSLDQSPPVFTGNTQDLVDRGNHRDYAEVWLKQEAPMPFTVVSIVPKWTPSGD